MCHAQCKCCKEIQHNAKTFRSIQTGETFDTKYHLMCNSSYVIYLIECWCGVQYVDRTTQLHKCLNTHKENIKKKFQLHSLSRHCATSHPDNLFPLRITPIDHVDLFVHNRFSSIKRKYTYWIFKSKSLQPGGLNKLTEMIT